MSTWGELRTAWHMALGPAADSIEGFEFDDHIHAAEVYLAGILPDELVPELVEMEEANVHVGAMAQYAVPYAYFAPDSVGKVTIRWEGEDMELTHLTPVMTEARMVSFVEFYDGLIHSSERLAHHIGKAILCNEAPGTGYDAGALTAIVLYKKVPTYPVASAGGEPDISPRWHGLMLDYALANVWLKIGDKDKSMLYHKQFTERLQHLGISRMEKK